MKQVIATVISNSERIPGIERPHGRSILFSQIIRLNCPEIAREAKPGQFVMVRCGEECILPRPFSIHQVNERGDMALYFAVLEDGKGTNWLSRCQKGDTIEMAVPKPLGNGFFINPISKNLLLVAGGIGIAPLYFLADEALKKGCSVTLLYGTEVKYRYPAALLPSGIKVVAATEDGTVGHHGLLTDLLPDFTGWADQIFACGPVSMYRDVALRKKDFGLEGKPVQVSLEVVMGCGRGVCYGCTLKTRSGLKQVCRDGPVFDLDNILFTGDLQITEALV